MEKVNERPMTVYEYVAYKRNRSQYQKEVTDQLNVILNDTTDDVFYLNNGRLTEPDLKNLLKEHGFVVKTTLYNVSPLYGNRYVIERQ